MTSESTETEHVERDSIEVEGTIDLVARVTHAQNAVTDNGVRRRSRLNDVMIVIEREKQAVQTAIALSVHQSLPELAVDRLELSLHASDPRFEVAIVPAGETAALSPQRQRALELAISDSVSAFIHQRAAPSNAPHRWQPAVKASLRTASQAAPSSSTPVTQHRSPWPRIFLVLMALIAAATAYLYVKQFAN